MPRWDIIIHHFSTVLLTSSPLSSCCHLSKSVRPKPNYECIKTSGCSMPAPKLCTGAGGKKSNKGNWYHHKSHNGAEEGHWPLLNPQDYHRIFCFSTYSHLPHPILLKLLTLSLLPHSWNLISPFTWLRKQNSLDNSLNFQPPNLQTHLYHAHPVLLSLCRTGTDIPLLVPWKLYSTRNLGWLIISFLPYTFNSPTYWLYLISTLTSHHYWRKRVSPNPITHLTYCQTSGKKFLFIFHH